MQAALPLMGFARAQPILRNAARVASMGWVEPLRNPSPLAEASAIFTVIARPILRIDAEPNHSMERRVRPIDHPANVVVLHGVEMNVVDVTREVVFTAQSMFPIPPLPNTAFALAGTAWRDSLADGQRSRKCSLDQSPAQRKIGVAFRHCPNSMKMVRQNHRRFDNKWMPCIRVSKCSAQQFDMFGKQTQSAVSQIDGKE